VSERIKKLREGGGNSRKGDFLRKRKKRAGPTAFTWVEGAENRQVGLTRDMLFIAEGGVGSGKNQGAWWWVLLFWCWRGVPSCLRRGSNAREHRVFRRMKMSRSL